MHKKHVIGLGWTLLSALCAFSAACSGAYSPNSLQAIQARGTLVILTRNAPTTYYIGSRGKPTGPEYRMAAAFAEYIGVEPKFVVKESVSDLLAALARGRGDMIAGGITRTARREKHFDFGPTYQTVTQQIVCGRGVSPDNVAELQSVELKVIADSSYVMRLRELKKTHPGLHWTTTNKTNTEGLLRQVWTGKLDCTVADSTIVEINRRYFPNLDAEFAISEPQPLAWVIPEHGAESLREAMQKWFGQYKSSGSLDAMLNRYYSFIPIFDFVGVRAFKRKIEHVWPKYKSAFYEAARENGLPPLILAAQSYQESHWNPHAQSPTGVRGMLMLTLDTAKQFGVAKRLNPFQSIRGGARYLAHLEERFNEDGMDIPRHERLWFALAAYNIGYYHVRDARRLARKLGKNPNSWDAVSEVLPLLSERRYYKNLPYGYARGMVAVRYVRRIRDYADILRHQIRNDGGG